LHILLLRLTTKTGADVCAGEDKTVKGDL
jgi:hypothetical protein